LKDNTAVKILGFIVRLSVLCAAAGLLLSYVYKVTKPGIEAQKVRAVNEAMKEVLPEAVEFRENENGVLSGYDGNAAMVGRVMQSQERGYGGPVKVMVGVDPGDRILGVKVLEHYETPGLGDAVTRDSFLKQFGGMEIGQVGLVKDRGEVNAVTGATISSKACVAAVKKALAVLPGGISDE